MSEILKHLSERLHRQYGLIVRRPMPWRMIDVLVSLEEKLEARGQTKSSREDENGVGVEKQSDNDGAVRPGTSHRHE